MPIADLSFPVFAGEQSFCSWHFRIKAPATNTDVLYTPLCKLKRGEIKLSS